MWLLIAFIVIPLIEIGLFIQVGGFIGLWPTLAIVLITAIAGSWLVRSQGLRELARLQESFTNLRDPSESLASGAMILFAGALLLTPGFFTDAVGLSLLLPPVRQAIYKNVRSRVKVHSVHTQQTSTSAYPHDDPDVINADFTEVEPEKDATQKPSGWTRH